MQVHSTRQVGYEAAIRARRAPPTGRGRGRGNCGLCSPVEFGSLTTGQTGGKVNRTRFAGDTFLWNPVQFPQFRQNRRLADGRMRTPQGDRRRSTAAPPSVPRDRVLHNHQCYFIMVSAYSRFRNRFNIASALVFSGFNSRDFL